jgi:hypothetical protein
LNEPVYFPRAVDQGIGRALWFIHGARIPEVTAAVARFAPARRPDLWSGVGLAATFAGGADADGFGELAVAACDHSPELAQGAVFAAKARSFAELVPAHTELAVGKLAGLSASEAAQLVDAAVSAPHTVGSGLVYEQWQAYVRRRFARVGPNV